ncbi:MAG: Gfo/Idh/MocA family oxidoreductase [Acidimicrobiia bacterium]|nr:Gfo/Idh/MocA family oxidoreductase [Acidimicrobiia bacterium]
MHAVRIGVVGYGYWGPNLVRTLIDLPEVVLVVVAERDPARMQEIRDKHPQVEVVVSDHKQLLSMELDAVAVVTPPETHFSIVKEYLENGLDVFVEKPITTSADDAAQLVTLAEERGRVLMVGHIAEYHPTIRALKEIIDSGELGPIRYIDTVRAGLGLFHPSLNVIWDLAPHDISILIHLLGAAPTHASTSAIACVQDSVEDVAYSAFTFPNGVLAHSRLSWLDPLKMRRITVVGSDKMVVYDDLEPHEKLKIYDKHVTTVPKTDTFGDFQFAYHYGSVTSPYVEFEEPLRIECRHFAKCVIEGSQPMTDGRSGLRVVQVIEAAQESLRNQGSQVAVGSASSTVGARAIDVTNGTESPARGKTGALDHIKDNDRSVLGPPSHEVDLVDSNGGGAPGDRPEPVAW